MRALYVSDSDSLSALFSGTIEGVSDQTVVASVRLSVPSVSYLRTLPTLSWPYLGVLTSASKFYLAAYNTTLYIDPAGTPKTLSSKIQGIILSSDPSETCQTMFSVAATTGTLT
jgi:hypothetical protein